MTTAWGPEGHPASETVDARGQESSAPENRETVTYAATPLGPAARRSTPPPAVPGYEVLEELGRGGMGVVYKARQTALNRLVALKMILAGSHAGPRELARFKAEAEAVARLQHPNIVQIYEVGEHEGLPYLALEFVDGGTLAGKLRAPLPGAEAARLLETLARAVAHAHARGVLHRDLKPANVLLAGQASSPVLGEEDRRGRLSDDGCVPRITDFGLAKQLDTGTGQTQSGAVLGTPSYMAPEQAAGRTHEIGTAADIYALGAILYEALTSRPPFQGASLLDTLEQVRLQEPVPPRQLQPRVPRDLEVICLKCLEKEPARRYASAADLAEDLRRFRAGEPIRARPVGTRERLFKWAKRRPALAALVAVSAAASLLLVGLLSTGLVLIAQKQERTEKALRAEEAARQQADEAWRGEQQARHNEEKARKNAVEALRRERLRSYLQGMALAEREYLANSIGRVEQLLDECPKEYRNWEWHYLRRLCHTELLTLRGHTLWVNAVVFTPDGRRLVSGSADRTIKVWDSATGRELKTLRGHDHGVMDVAVSPDGKWVVSADVLGEVKLWGLAASGPGRTLCRSTTRDVAHGLAFSPDGRRVAIACRDGTVHVRTIANGSLVQTLAGDKTPLLCVAYSCDGALLASGDDGGKVQVWDAATGQVLRTLTGHLLGVRRLAFSPDGKHLVSASDDRTVKLWDLVAGRDTRTLSGHTAHVPGVAFSPDGRRVASAGADGAAKVWDATTGQELMTLRGHGDGLARIAYSPDARRVATASADSTVKVWDATTGRQPLVLARHRQPVPWVVFSPAPPEAGAGGRRLAWPENYPAGKTSQVNICDTATGEVVQVLRGHLGPIQGLAFSADGKLLASAGDDRRVLVWEIATSKTRCRIGTPGRASRVAFSPDGRRLALAGSFRTVHVCDAATGKEVQRLAGHTGSVTGLEYSRDGKWLASASMDGTVKLWDAATGAERRTLSGHNRPLQAVAFSPDGTKVASAGDDRTARLWDVASGKQLAVLRGHRMMVESVAFSHGGDRLVTGGRDGSVRFWGLAGEGLLSLSGHGDGVMSVAFSPDGQMLASSGWDRTVRLWHIGEDRQSPRAAEQAVVAWHAREAEDASRARQWPAALFHLDYLIQARPKTAGLYEARGTAHGQAGQWARAVADCTKAIELGATGWQVWSQRAGAHAEQRHWKEAAADYARAVAQQADDPVVWHRQALLCLQQGDAAGYRRVCARCVKKFGQGKGLGTVNAVLWINLLAVNPDVAPDKVVALAEQVVKRSPKTYAFQGTLAMACYRAGRFDRAVACLGKAIELHGDGGAPQDWLLLAMAHKRLGQEKEARQWLDRGIKFLDDLAKAQAAQPLSGPRPAWDVWLEVQLLRREAEALWQKPGQKKDGAAG